jgi:hypothetical protein
MRRTLLIAAALTALAAGPPDDQLTTRVDARVKEWQPTADERRFDEIGWAADLRTALRLAREHQRPVFLFTMDGRINTGRC